MTTGNSPIKMGSKLSSVSDQPKNSKQRVLRWNCTSVGDWFNFYAICLITLASLVITTQAKETIFLRLVQTIPLPNVEGRIDHLAIDIKGQRLFVAALANNTLEIIDLHTGKLVRSIGGLKQPQGVLYIPESNKIFVTNGRDGSCEILDGNSLNFISGVDFADDADNLRYDAAAKRVYVGYGSGGLGIVDAVNGTLLGNIRLAEHPESFQLEENGKRIFINVPRANHVSVIDREKRVVITTWPVNGARENFPMALDETNHRLFVGFRKPAQLIVFDTESGEPVVSINTCGDADDIFYDALRKRIYMSCGEGFINLFEQSDTQHYKAIAKIPTAWGARTSLFVPELNRFYLAVPHRGGQRAEVRIYEVVH